MTQPNQPELSPPQVTYFNQLKYSIGNDPFLTVIDLYELPKNAGYLIPIWIRNEEKARALATILETQREIGNIPIYVVVLFDGNIAEPYDVSKFNARDISKLVEDALETNRYFLFSKVAFVVPGTVAVYPVFTKSVTQFYNEDLSDLYRNYNEVAAEVFKEVFQEKINGIDLDPSTEE
ncbi:hypothetical protein, partial [Pontibacillus marinus]|uniref:Uncharacterized protein n=1 Tax=Pontibacillus marinus BH030004 = DSM 16465 TaxID=1385511 RepID=A0A0A5GEU0_9BACI